MTLQSPSNYLLRSLGEADFSRIRPMLRATEMEQKHLFWHPGDAITEVHFVESGIVSKVIVAPEYRIEVGIVGREGLVGASALLGVAQSPFEVFCQVSGEVLSIGVADLDSVSDEVPRLRDLMLRFIHSSMVQAAQTALANGRCTLEERLARWLLMARDRLERDEIPLTHEFLSLMLGVHRPGVTIALQTLEGAEMIRNSRGLVSIINPSALREIAGGSYTPLDGMADAT